MRVDCRRLPTCPVQECNAAARIFASAHRAIIRDRAKKLPATKPLEGTLREGGWSVVEGRKGAQMRRKAEPEVFQQGCTPGSAHHLSGTRPAPIAAAVTEPSELAADVPAQVLRGETPAWLRCTVRSCKACCCGASVPAPQLGSCSGLRLVRSLDVGFEFEFERRIPGTSPSHDATPDLPSPGVMWLSGSRRVHMCFAGLDRAVHDSEQRNGS